MRFLRFGDCAASSPMPPRSMLKGFSDGRLFAEADARANEPFEKVPPLGGGVEHGMIRELWTYRELAYFLAWRDIKVRYKQTVLGVLWAVIQPFFTMVVFVLLFGQLAKIPTDGIPGPIFYFTALVPWTYFSRTVRNPAMNLPPNTALLTTISS